MMRTNNRAIVMLLLLFAAPVVAVVASGAQAKKGSEREIRAVLDAQVEAWNRHDIEGFMKGYWRSPELTFYSGATTVSGWDETLARYRKRYLGAGNEMGNLEFTDLRIEMLGDSAAFVRGRFHLKMTSGESGGLFTLTFRKFQDGWKIVHDHTST